jgi:hypothetical protein
MECLSTSSAEGHGTRLKGEHDRREREVQIGDFAHPLLQGNRNNL